MKPFLPSLLFIPALEERFWQKLPQLAHSLGAIAIDLEDSIHHSAKERARRKVLEKASFLTSLRQEYPHLKVTVRINNVRTEHFKRDVALIVQLAETASIDGVFYPKLENTADLDYMGDSFPVDQVFIAAAIETLMGYRLFRKTLLFEKGVRWCVVGGEDLCADMNIDRPTNFYDNPLLLRIVTDVALFSKITGITFWGNIWPYLLTNELLSSLTEECLMDQRMGAIGKAIFHPYQINVVNGIFNFNTRLKTQQCIMAGRLAAISERAHSSGLTVAIHNGRMVDMPELVRLERWIQDIEGDQVKNIFKEQLRELKSL